MAVELCFSAVKGSSTNLFCYHKTHVDKYTFSCNLSRVGDTGLLKISWMKESSKLIRISCFAEVEDRVPCFKNTLLVHNVTKACVPIKYASLIIAHIIPKVQVFENLSDPRIASSSVLSTAPQIARSPSVSTKSPEQTTRMLKQLSEDFVDLFQNKNLSDVVITDGSDEIRAHKVLLAARSPVFAKMLQHPFKENQESRISIPDIPFKVLEDMLRYMYTGDIVIKDRNVALELYLAAEKYQIKGLREVCAELLKSVSAENVFDTLIFADMCNNRVLTAAATNFVCKNFNQLKELSSWDTFQKENSRLANKLLLRVIDWISL